MSDIPWGQIASGIGKGINSFDTGNKANSQMQAAYAEMMRNLRERFADYDNMGKAGYQDVTAQQVGPSGLEGMPEDLQSRQAQQEAMAALADISKNGGLSLADMKALNEVQNNLNQNDTTRRQGLANEFAARGQLGSGAQLAMALQGQQNAAMNANQRAEGVQAQAQARALQAILQKGQMASQMGNEDYRRKAEAARARDAIEARNAAARMDAMKSNNSYRGQAFADEMNKARGKTQLTGDMNKAVFGSGTQNANTTLAQGSAVNGGLDEGAALLGTFNKDQHDPNETSKIAADESGNRGGFADISDPDDK